MQYGRSTRKIGPTFFTKIGKTAQLAATAGNRNNYEEYARCRAEIISFLDEVAEQAGFTQVFGPEESDVEETKPASDSRVGKKSRAAKPKAKAAKGE